MNLNSVSFFGTSGTKPCTYKLPLLFLSRCAAREADGASKQVAPSILGPKSTVFYTLVLSAVAKGVYLKTAVCRDIDFTRAV